MNSWVLLRGWARDRSHWGDFPDTLASRLPVTDGVRALDLPGNGSLHRQASPSSVAGMVEAYRQQLPRDGRARILLGLSLGGMVGLEWAHRYPQEVAAVVMVNSSSGALSPFWQRLRPAAWPALAASAFLPAWRREQLIYRLCSHRPERADQTVPAWVAQAHRHPIAAANALRQLRAAAGWRLPLPRPPVPLLVVTSWSDRLVAPLCSLALAAHWRLPVRIHLTAGHELALDDPPWLADTCAHWVVSLQAEAAGTD